MPGMCERSVGVPSDSVNIGDIPIASHVDVSIFREKENRQMVGLFVVRTEQLEYEV